MNQRTRLLAITLAAMACCFQQPLGPCHGGRAAGAEPYGGSPEPEMYYGELPDAGMPYGEPPAVDSPAGVSPAGVLPAFAWVEGLKSSLFAEPIDLRGPYAAEGAGDCDGPECFPARRWRGRAEYLLWWTKDSDVPALATTSPDGAPASQAGVPGQPGTTILFGGDPLYDEVRSGGRFMLGLWIDPSHCAALDVTYFFLADETAGLSASDRDRNILARPFFNTQADAQDARHVVFPGNVQGELAIEASTRLEGFEVTYSRATMRTECLRTDFLLGYRFVELADQLRIAESTLSLSGPTAGATFDLFDHFDTRSQFHGAQFGMAMQWQRSECWSWELVGKVALGETQSHSRVRGQTTTTTVAGSATNEGGLLTQPTNLHTVSGDDFAVLSEFGVTLRRDWTNGWSATIGYTFFHWNEVARAGDQIDPVINPTQIPPGTLSGEPRPAFSFASTDFWAQGLQFGLEWNY